MKETSSSKSLHNPDGGKAACIAASSRDLEVDDQGRVSFLLVEQRLAST